MSKITLIIPTTFTKEGGTIKSYFATKAGLQKPATYGYLISKGNGWSVHVGSDKDTFFKDQNLTAQLLISELRRLPDCALLVSSHDGDYVAVLLKQAGHKVNEKSYMGELKTGGW